jgi:hypothetical protein
VGTRNVLSLHRSGALRDLMKVRNVSYTTSQRATEEHTGNEEMNAVLLGCHEEKHCLERVLSPANI